MHPNHVQQGHHPHPNIHPSNGTHQQQNGLPHHPPSHRANSQQPPKDPITVVGIPSVTVQNDQLVVGGSQSSSTRSYTPLKVVGDGSFGTVWLCDWHGTLPPNTPMSAMQCGAGARPEYAGKRLVAVKRMKKRWEGGWDECKRLKELESLRAIPYHPNIIPLYDFFLLPSTKELYFVFESMEGNLYQLIKTRKGKPLAGGLVSSIFEQVVAGLDHIHASGYFHRDMKPENLLVTTTGLYDYRPLAPNVPPDAPPERDVVVIVKLADFGLAREIKSKPPYTEYVSTRWYRAPEVLLKSRDYSSPVDMWALGTIMAELVNLRPLFPGSGEVDQVARICDVLGDPCDDYGIDTRGRPFGGGRWPRGVKMAKAVGFAFPKTQPRDIYSLFDHSVPIQLVHCIADLLKYDPDIRLTSRECLEHPYLQETMHLNNPPGPPTQPAQVSVGQPVYARSAYRNGNETHSTTSLPSITPRSVPPSHSHPALNPQNHGIPSPHPVNQHIPDASSSHRSSFYDPVHARARTISDVSHRPSEYMANGPYTKLTDVNRLEQQHSVPAQASAERFANVWIQSPVPQNPPRDWDAMDVSPQLETPSESYVTSSHPMDIQTSPMVQEYPARPHMESEHIHDSHQETVQSQSNKFPKLAALSFGKKHSKWGLGMFGHSDKNQSSMNGVHESAPSADSIPSLKRTSSSVESHSLSELSPIDQVQPPPLDEKARKKAAQRMAEEAERQRRARAMQMQIEQARSVMNKRRFVEGRDLTWLSPDQTDPSHDARSYRMGKGKQPAPSSTGPIRQVQSYGPTSPTISAAGGNYKMDPAMHRPVYHGESERMSKVRRREYSDDHSMSSSDMQSGMSVISFATVDSDPGPNRARHRPSLYGMSRMTSMSSLRPSSIDDFPSTGRSSASLSLEQQLVNDFHLRASVDSSSISDGGSPQPPPMHMLSLSSPIPWQHSDNSNTTVDNRSIGSAHQTLSSPIYTPPPLPYHPGAKHGPPTPYDSQGVYGHPPSPGMAPKSAINPIFKVPQNFPNTGDKPPLALTPLPPFSQLMAVADGEYPPLSPMSFTIPEDIAGEEDA
ncbi:hypothetical protein ABKN59_001243 [Abortiporus biennis]